MAKSYAELLLEALIRVHRGAVRYEEGDYEGALEDFSSALQELPGQTR